VKKSVAIIGGGPAGMAVAANLDNKKFEVTIFEKNKALGRKFLVAGKGGFNLTHGTPMSDFVKKYTPTNFLRETLLNFNNDRFRSWLADIRIKTFVGTSNRIFPVKGIKPIEVLNAIQTLLKEKKVNINYQAEWTGWNDKYQLTFANQHSIKSDITIFALGGGSWKITGSDGHWINTFQNAGIITIPFFPSNCAYQISWPKSFITTHEGSPLKNIAIRSQDKSIKGEVVITKLGMEGNAIYGLSPEIRKELNQTGKALIYIDLKPTLDQTSVLDKLKTGKQKNTSEILKRDLKLSAAQLGLLKHFLSKEEFLNPELLAKLIKNLPIEVLGFAPIDEAISTVGGIALDEVDSTFQLYKMPQTYCIGEMLDWDAPTGGYLLQACFSMGFELAGELNKKGF